MTKESAAKSMLAQRKTDAAVGRLAEAESEAQEAADLLDKNKEDFDKQFAENEAALAESEDNVSFFEILFRKLKKKKRGFSDPLPGVVSARAERRRLRREIGAVRHIVRRTGWRVRLLRRAVLCWGRRHQGHSGKELRSGSWHQAQRETTRGWKGRGYFQFKKTLFKV